MTAPNHNSSSSSYGSRPDSSSASAFTPGQPVDKSNPEELPVSAYRKRQIPGKHIMTTGQLADIDHNSVREEEPFDYAAGFSDCLITSAALCQLEVKPKQRILGEFFREGDLGILYAPRGLGKTWLTTAMASAISKGKGCGLWEAGEEAHRVLVVDGEMALSQSNERFNCLEANSENQLVLHHEQFFLRHGRALNIACPTQQRSLTETILRYGISVVFLDNLSSLALGLAENQADDWEQINGWFLSLRRHNVAVVMVAHAGKNGSLRGTSRREDTVNWVLKLSLPPASATESDGATFICELEKNRNSTADLCPSTKWSFPRQNPARFQCERFGSYETFLDLVKEGHETATSISEVMGLATGSISRMANRARAEGRITKEGRKYRYVEEEIHEPSDPAVYERPVSPALVASEFSGFPLDDETSIF